MRTTPTLRTCCTPSRPRSSRNVTRWVTPALTVVGSDLKDVLTRLVEYIGENADICSVLLSDKGDNSFQAKVVNVIEGQFMELLGPRRGSSARMRRNISTPSSRSAASASSASGCPMALKSPLRR